ncbi:MAG: L,D-transpeptidase [Clostridia bacterium]|nr:L,D-transpeptidase [Clostridia bacterium]
MSGDVYGQYASRITGSILFHSVPYVYQDKSTLEWWEYDKLGQTASLGCVRLTVEDAKWIYSNCIAGTKVEFYASSNPGPLGKPTAKKISEDEDVRNWDPTDPDSNNPWKTYTKPTTTKPATGNQAVNNTNTAGNNVIDNNTVNNVTNSNNVVENIVEDKTNIKNTTVDTELVL